MKKIPEEVIRHALTFLCSLPPVPDVDAYEAGNVGSASSQPVRHPSVAAVDQALSNYNSVGATNQQWHTIAIDLFSANDDARKATLHFFRKSAVEIRTRLPGAQRDSACKRALAKTHQHLTHVDPKKMAAVLQELAEECKIFSLPPQMPETLQKIGQLHTQKTPPPARIDLAQEWNGAKGRWDWFVIAGHTSKK